MPTPRYNVHTFSSGAIRANRHLAIIAAVMVRSTDLPNALPPIKPTNQGSRENQYPSTMKVMLFGIVNVVCIFPSD